MTSISEIRFYLSIFWRRFPYFLVASVFVTAVGLAVAVLLPPVYKSTASVLVEAQQIPSDLATSTVAVGSTEQLQIIEQRLMTRSNLLEMARRLDLYADKPDMTASEIVDDMRERTAFDPVNLGRGGATAFQISFEAPTASQASGVANEIVTLVLQENVRMRTDRATDTLEFFENEVDRLAGELDVVSSEILAFKNANEDSLPDSLDFRRAEQARLQERLLQLEREETSLRDTRARLVQVFEQTGRLNSVNTEPMSDEEAELQKLKQTLEQQLVLFSESNPKIILLRSRVKALEKIVANQRDLTAGVVGPDEEINELDLELEQLDSRLDYIDTEQARLDADLRAITKTIQETPANEIHLSGLERRHANLQAQYNDTVKSRAAAATGERIELLSKGERFSVIEQATEPSRPDSPNRKLLAAGSVLAGLFSGLAVVILMELLNRSIRRPVEITNKLGIQPFGTVPYVRTRQERLTKRAIIMITLLLFAVAIPAGIWALHTYYMPLDLLLQQVIEKLGLEPYLGSLI